MTPKQQATYFCIQEFEKITGRKPSTREVANMLGCSQNNAWRLMKAVAKLKP